MIFSDDDDDDASAENSRSISKGGEPLTDAELDGKIFKKKEYFLKKMKTVKL
jgi:hypothetical protein